MECFCYNGLVGLAIDWDYDTMYNEPDVCEVCNGAGNCPFCLDGFAAEFCCCCPEGLELERRYKKITRVPLLERVYKAFEWRYKLWKIKRMAKKWKK